MTLNKGLYGNKKIEFKDLSRTTMYMYFHFSRIQFHLLFKGQIYLNMHNSFPPLFCKNSKTCFKRPLKKKTKKLVFKTDYCSMQVKTREHSTIFSTFIKLPFFFKTFVLSIFEPSLKTGFTVQHFLLIFSHILRVASRLY